MSDVTIKISIDPASGVRGMSADTGAGPVPTELSAAMAAVETAVDAPGPAAGILEEAHEGFAATNEVGPAPVEPSQLGADVAAEGAAIGEAAPPPEDLEVFDAEADAAAEEDAPEPMPLADLEAESTAKAGPKEKPRRQTKKKA